MNTRTPRRAASPAMIRTSLAAVLAKPSSPPGMSLCPCQSSRTSGRTESKANKKRVRALAAFSPPSPWFDTMIVSAWNEYRVCSSRCSTVGYAAAGTTTCLPLVRPAVDPGNVTSPAVMLSPNAMKCTRCNCAARVTFTRNSQVACRFNPSVAVQLTVVSPIGNSDPDAGVQLTLTGVCPSRVSGVGYETASPAGSMVARLTPGSHETVGAGGGGGGGGGSGALGVLLHPPAQAIRRTVQNSKRRPVTRQEPNHI